MNGKPPISTHILDTTRGVPAVGVNVKSSDYLFQTTFPIKFFHSNKKVSLFKLVDGNWLLINESVTNSDGRCADLLLREAFKSGRYKLYFDVDKYFQSTRTASIYPFVEVSIWKLTYWHAYWFGTTNLYW